MSVRELGKLTEIDHAYIHRLETGEKTSPSRDVVQKLLAVLRLNERDAEIVRWLVEHPDTDSALVEHVLENTDIDFDLFTMAAGVRHRGAVRPDPATLIARCRRALSDE